MHDLDITGWFTTDEGNHIPIHGDQSKIQAMKQFANEHNSSSMSIEEHRRYVSNLGMEAGEAGSEKWNKWFKESQKLAKREQSLKDTYKNNYYKDKSSHYVNEYGEATHRKITSGTYERAKARQQKDLDNWFMR